MIKKVIWLSLSLTILLILTNCGGDESKTSTPSEGNQVPIANAGSDKSAKVNQSITIVGSATDSDGRIVSYEWKKGNIVLATTPTFNYLPTVVGTDKLTLVVIDNDGAVASDSMVVTVTENSTSTLSKGLVAHYEFEGNANDSSGNGHHGIEYGNISYIANNNKQALHCNNGGIKTLTSYFDKDWAINTNRAEATTYFHNISNQSKSQTISVWFKTTEYNLEEWGGAIVSISNNSSRIGISIKQNFLKIEYGTDSDFIIKELSSTIINDGLWKHVVIVSNGDNGEKKVYVNGIFKLTFNNGYNSNASKGYYRICGYTLYNRGYKNNYHGDIDNLRIYNRALNEVEIQELYNLKQ